MLENRPLREKIEKFLTVFPHCRDDDHRLIANIWQEEMIELVGQQKYMESKAVDLLGFLAKGKLSNPESIRRIRQKVQELQPMLRGEKYRDRQKHEGAVRKEIRQYR